MISAKVNVVGGWGTEFARRVNHQVREALDEAAKVGAEEASRIARERTRTGHMAEIDVIPARGTATGWVAGFRSRAWYAGFQSRGTLGSRRARLRASTLRRRASVTGAERLAKVGGSRGITPLHFLEKGRAAARKHLIDRLNRL